MDHNESSPDFSEALLYRQNNTFIEGNRPEPHNAKEIKANLESRLGPLPSRFSLWRRWILGIGALILTLCFAAVFLFAFMHVFHIERLNMKVAGIIGGIGSGSIWLVILLIGNLVFGNTFSDFAHNPVDTPVTRWEIYLALIESGEVVNGTIVDVVKLGDVLITYSVKTPTLKKIQRSYKTSLPHYSREDIGKEVAVLYLNETVNALL